MPMIPRRLVLLGLPLAAAGCATDDPAALPPLVTGYRHLTPLRLNVGEIVFPDPAAAVVRVDLPAPLRPEVEVRRMGQERLVASGTAGQARFVVRTAEFRRERLAPAGGLAGLFSGEPGERLTCRVGAELELRDAEEQAARVEAEARRSRTLPDGTSAAARLRAAEEIVRQAMDDLNVEFEFQVRRVLRAWLVEIAVPGPDAVEREDLERPPPR
jgi:hypothetical protein